MRLRAPLIGAVLLALVACSSSAGSGAGSSGVSTTHQPVTVFAAASLTDALTDATGPLGEQGLDVTYSFGGSGALVQQVQQGAPADVIATADATSMQSLVDAGLVELPTTFARNELEILVAPGNPKQVTGIADLGRSDLVFVTEDDSVPAGKYTAAMLRAAGITAHLVSKEPNVKAAVAKVVAGEADVTVVYLTDVLAAGPKGQGVAIPAAQNQVATYPIAIVKATGHHAAAEAFVAAALRGAVADALRARGFEAAS